KSTEHTDGEGRSEIAIRLKRGNRKHQAEQDAGRAGERGAERKRGDVSMLDTYTHEGSGITVHPDRNDGATEPRAPQQEGKSDGNGECGGGRDGAVERNFQADDLGRAQRP